MKVARKCVGAVPPADRAPNTSNQLLHLQAEREKNPTFSWWHHVDSGKKLTGGVAKRSRRSNRWWREKAEEVEEQGNCLKDWGCRQGRQGRKVGYGTQDLGFIRKELINIWADAHFLWLNRRISRLERGGKTNVWSYTSGGIWQILSPLTASCEQWLSSLLPLWRKFHQSS